MENMISKKDKLIKVLEGYGSLAVAFSGGVDSAFLLDTASKVLGKGLLALTAEGAWFPEWESREAEQFCKDRGIRQLRIRVCMEDIEGFAQNPPDRCYLCKKVLFRRIQEEAAGAGYSVLAEGSNMDDLGDYRPGRRAIEEMKIVSPLLEAGLYKEEIRSLSELAGLSTARKPSYACLASRFPYGDRISYEKLAMVEKGEDLLLALGFKQMRVRIHGNLARIELPEKDMPVLMEGETRKEIADGLKKLGFAYVSLDLQGFRSGSMNETL